MHRNWNNWNLELVDLMYAHIGHMAVIRMLTMSQIQDPKVMLLTGLLLIEGPETSNLKPGLYKNT